MVILGSAHRARSEQHSAEYEAWHMSQVRKRDDEALASIGILFTSNKAKKNNASHAHAEGMHMLRSDKESTGREAFDGCMAQAKRDANKARSSGTLVGEDLLPKFYNGHSCIQWWAGWMKDATEVPKSYNNKNRPAWFKGEVLGYEGKKSIFYAGFQNPEQHVYHVY